MTQLPQRSIYRDSPRRDVFAPRRGGIYTSLWWRGLSTIVASCRSLDRLIIMPDEMRRPFPSACSDVRLFPRKVVERVDAVARSVGPDASTHSGFGTGIASAAATSTCPLGIMRESTSVLNAPTGPAFAAETTTVRRHEHDLRGGGSG